MSPISPPSEADPTQSLVRSVRRIAQAIDVRSREIARLTGLTLPQILVLQSIRTLGEVSTLTVSRDVSMSAPTVVAVLDKLEAKGLIIRYRSAIDRRIVHARLTPMGDEALNTAPALLPDAAISAFAALPDHRRHEVAQALQTVSDLLARAPATGAAEAP